MAQISRTKPTRRSRTRRRSRSRRSRTIAAPCRPKIAPDAPTDGPAVTSMLAVEPRRGQEPPVFAGEDPLAGERAHGDDRLTRGQGASGDLADEDRREQRE